MSSNRRPWYKWYPKDFVVDEKVQSLSPIAELIYRRALDVMWQAKATRLPNVCYKLANMFGNKISEDDFKKAWEEIQFPGFELFKTTEDGQWIYSKRLLEQMKDVETIKELRTELGKKGGLAKAKKYSGKSQKKIKQKGSDTDTDIKEIYKEKFGEFKNVFLTEFEFKKLIETFGEPTTRFQIENLSTYIESKGKKYKSHYATILNWNRKDGKKPEGLWKPVE